MPSAASAHATRFERTARGAVLAGLALALVVAPIAFVPQLYDDFTLVKQATLFAAAAVALLGLAAAGIPFPMPRGIVIALALFALALFLSEMFGLDPRGSILGVYQYRQGLATQLTYLVLFVASAYLCANGDRPLLTALPAAGLAGAALYTLVQALGRDPIDWWLDTSDRAIGTIGNANELAAYAVIALSSAGPLFARAGRWGSPAAAAIVGASTFCIVEAESRSGLAAIALFVALLPVAWLLAGNRLREGRRLALVVASGFTAGLLLSLAAGGLAGSRDRIEGGVAGADAGGSTRVSLWRGTLEVVKAEPLTGVGPDALFLAFPVHRPSDLGGAFDSYDLVAQSSHNLALDTAANYGLPGLAALVALVSLAGWNAIVRQRSRSPGGDQAAPFVWAAVTAYGALTLVNPVSLAAHALFWVLLGAFASEGHALPAQRPAASRRSLAAAPAGLALAATVILAPRMLAADLSANAAWEDVDAGRFPEAAEHYADANRLVPLERRYLQGEAEARLANAATAPGANILLDASAAYAELERDFEFTAGDVLSLAAIEIALGGDSAKVEPLVARALALNPHGVAMAEYTARLRTAAAEGNGVLQYSTKDHWTYIALGEQR